MADTHLLSTSEEFSRCTGVYLGLQAGGLTSPENATKYIAGYLQWLSENEQELTTKAVILAYERMKYLDAQSMESLDRDLIKKCQNYFVHVTAE